MDNDLQKQYEQMIEQERINAGSNALALQQKEISMQEQERGMIHEQLDVSEILDRMHHLLKGFTLEMNQDTGQMEWVAPTSSDQQVLTDYGVKYIMGMIQAHVNKNTLMANYREEVIDYKMLDIGNTMNDTIFTEYDKMFVHPTSEECYKELELRIEEKARVLEYKYKFQGINKDIEQIKEELIKEITPRFETELIHIKEQKMKNKIKRFDSLFTMAQNTIHSAYLRAWNGQERTTLRQHIHISENKGNVSYPQGNNQWSPLGMFKR